MLLLIAEGVGENSSRKHPYMTTGKTIAVTRWTFGGEVMSLLFNMLSRLVITFLPRSKQLLISPPAFPRNPRGRLGFPGPTQGEG